MRHQYCYISVVSRCNLYKHRNVEGDGRSGLELLDSGLKGLKKEDKPKKTVCISETARG